MRWLARKTSGIVNVIRKVAGINGVCMKRCCQKLEDVAVVVSKEFNESYYLEQYPDVKESGVKAIEHFLICGFYEGRNPNSYFSTSYYAAQNNDILNDNENPFYHYLTVGRVQGRQSSEIEFLDLDMDPEHLSHIIDIVQSEFDAKYYLKRYPDIVIAGVDPVIHYILHGWREGRDPNGEFSSDDYLESNEDVAQAEINPFYHYLVAGRSEGRQLKKCSKAPSHNSIGEDELQNIIKTISPHFDSEFYLKMYAHVALSEMKPAEHYVREGWKAGYWPTPTFNTNFYIEDNVDVSEAGVNPFYHYIVAGQFERRYENQPGGDRAITIHRLKTATEIKREWHSKWAGEVLGSEALAKLFNEELTEENIISFSHDVYLDHIGGIQLCIAIEQKESGDSWQGYLHLAPIQPLPYLGEADSEALLYISLNGKYRGVATVQMLANQLKSSACKFFPVIHALHGHAPENVVTILKSSGCIELTLWLHDFFTLCEGYNVLRNNVAYCGVPPVNSNACSICIHGERRLEHIERLDSLLSNFKVHIISPSKYAASLWSEKAWFNAESVNVIEHLQFLGSRKRANHQALQPVRVGFIGYPAYHKGWGDFANLVRLFLTDNRYEFVHLGKEKMDVLPIEFVEAKATFNDHEATRKAVENANIDVVIIPAKWPETFNFTCYEAIAGGAKVLAYLESGNVADFLKKEGHGMVANGFNEMHELFTKGLPIVLLSGRRYFEASYSKMTLELLEK